MGEEEIENFPLRIFFTSFWSVKLFLYKFRGIYFPSFYSLCQRQSYSLKSFAIQPSVPSPLAPISIASLTRKLEKRQQNGAQNAPKSAYNSPKVVFFRTFGLL